MKRHLAIIICPLLLISPLVVISVAESANTLAENANALVDGNNIGYGLGGLNNTTQVAAVVNGNKLPDKMMCNEFVAVALMQSGLLKTSGNLAVGLTGLFGMLKAKESKDPAALKVGDVVFLLRDGGKCDSQPANTKLSDGHDDHVGIVVEKRSGSDAGVVLAECGSKERSCLKVVAGKTKGARRLFYPTSYLTRFMWGYASP